MRILKNFLLMLQFFTRLPIKANLPCEQKDFKNGAVFLPVVGLILGGFQFLFLYLTKTFLPVSIIAVFLTIIYVVITGGLHLDGLGDTCDGFFSFKGNKEKIIEIMKDSRIGTFACLAIVFDILLRYSAYTELLNKNFPLGIVFAPVAARFCTFFLCLIFKPAKPQGTGNLFVGNMGKLQFLVMTIITLFIGYLTIGVKLTISTLLIDIILTIIFCKLSLVKIGGMTGDTCGANNELTEVLSLLIIIAMLSK